MACVTLPCCWCMRRVCGKWRRPVSVGLSMPADQKGCVERDWGPSSPPGVLGALF